MDLRPAWGSGFLSDTAFNGAVATWGARGILEMPRPDPWRRKAFPQTPRLDLLGDRQDCRVVDETIRESLEKPLHAAVMAIRSRLEQWDYDERNTRLLMPSITSNGYTVDITVHLSYGYAHCCVIFKKP